MKNTQFKLEITLPYWLDLPNEFQFKIEYNKNKIEAIIKQLDWKLYLFKENNAFHATIPEWKLIDKHNFNIKQEITLNPNDEKISTFIPIKEKSKIEYNFTISDASDQSIYETWLLIKKETTRFLRFYSYYRILSTENQNPREYIAPLTNKYYTIETVQLFFRNKEQWRIFDRTPIVLRLGHFTNYPAFQLRHDSLSYLTEVMENNYNLRTEQNLLLQISEAHIHDNINNLVISIDIYLEFIVARFLEGKLNLSKSKLNKEFKEKGFNHFLNQVLPNYLTTDESKLINNCVKLHENRNKIIHLAEDFSSNTNIKSICNSCMDIIKILKSKMSSEYPSFKLAKSIIGLVNKVGENNEVQVQFFESYTQMKFIQSQPDMKNTTIYLPNIDFTDREEIEIKDEMLKHNSKILKVDNHIIFVFSFTPYNEKDFSIYLNRIENLIHSLPIINEEIILYPLGFLYPKNYKNQITKLENRISEKYNVKTVFNLHINKMAIQLNEFFKDKEGFIEESEIITYLKKTDSYFQPYYLYFLYQNLLLHKNENNVNYYKWKGLEITLLEDIKNKNG